MLDSCEQYITKAKLNSGDIVVFDACANREDAYNPKDFRFIGWGVRYSVNGVVQVGNTKECFFVKT